MIRRNKIPFLIGIIALTATSVLFISTEASNAQQNPPALQITSPLDGTVVAPGQILTVVAEPSQGTIFAQVIIIGQNPIGFSEVKTAPPFNFSLVIPADISPGRYRLIASGVFSPGLGVESTPITIIVEKSDSIVGLRVEPSTVNFSSKGDQMPLRVIGVFSDGTTLDISHSSQTAYSSVDARVATVDNSGIVMGVGPGITRIIVTYGTESAEVWVTGPPLISNVSAGSITSSGATITWMTDEVSDSQVEYGTTTAYGSSSPLDTALVTSHSMPLSGLAASTLYHYHVKSKDTVGNLAVSGDFTFTTLAPDTTPPMGTVTINAGATYTNFTTVTLTLSCSDTGTGCAQMQIAVDGTADTEAFVASATSATATLPAGDGTKTVAVKFKDGAGNVSAQVTDTIVLDTTPPTITGVSASAITATGATITWTTSEPADSQVDYGTTTSYGSSSALNTSLATSPSVDLSGLTASTLYHYRVKSRDAAGNLATSGDFTFSTTTAAGPSITSVTPASVTYGITTSRSIAIAGTNFALGATITVQGTGGTLSGMTVAGSSATATKPFVYTSKTSVRFWWDQTGLPPGSYDVTVTNPAAAGGLSVTVAGGFVVEAPQPAVSSLSYSSLTYGIDTSKSITISGSNFLEGATITIAGPGASLSGVTVSGSSATANTPFVYTTKTSLKFWWDQTGLPPGSYDVTVTNPAASGGASFTLAGGFVVEAPQPAVSSLNYSSVTYGITASKQVSISGSNFLEGATITVSGPGGSLSGVTVAGSSATATVPFVYYSKTSVKFWWDQTGLPQGSYDVTVTNPAAGGGLSDTLAGGFVVEAPQPTISSVTASSVTYGVTASRSIAISGSNFVLGATITLQGPVTLSGVANVTTSAATATQPFVYTSSASLKFWWANTALPAGTYNVTVTNPTAAGGLAATLTGGFTVQ
jgi:Purple acid Phosphatase, N-terminal domain